MINIFKTLKSCPTYLLEKISKLGPIALIVTFILSLLSIHSIFRLLLVIVNIDRIHGDPEFLMSFPSGLRMDMIIICYLSILPTLTILILSKPQVEKIKAIILGYIVSILSIDLFMEIATFPFMEEYDRRPDILFIDYLDSPREVLGTLFADYKIYLCIAFIAILILAYVSRKIFSSLLTNYKPWKLSIRLLFLPIVAGLIFLGARSSLGSRPANIGTAIISDNHLVNEITLNSTYTVLYAVYRRLSHEKNPTKIYGRMKRKEAFERVRNISVIPQSDFVESEVPFAHRQVSPFKRQRPLNLVIILEESLGARFVGSLGGKPLTPNYDALTKEGLSFTNLYATGTRTVRGMESVVAGFFPMPGRSVIKIGLSKENFFTIATLLKSKGYATNFLYGGMSNVDNMRNFFSGNGFDKIYDESLIDNAEFRGVWGVSDEDLFNKAHRIFKEYGDKPFFSLLLTTSNHAPFQFPEGKIELYDQPQATRHNSMKYADYAIGQFFKLAKTAPYYENTIFLVVADHDTRVKGNALVPIDRFHIPALIIGPDVPLMQFDKLSSQLDLLPTLLHFIGLTTIHPMMGRNLMTLAEEVPGRAFMQFGDHNAYRRGDDVLIMLPHKEPRQFRYRKNQLIPVNVDEEFAKDALAYSSMPWYLYREREYRLP